MSENEPKPASNALSGRRKTGLLALAALLVGLLLCEVLLRLLHLAPATGIGSMDLDAFARLPGFFAPGQHVLDTEIPALPYWVTIDSLGFRVTMPGNGRRVIYLGDSFVYGDFVDDAQTLPSQLAQATGWHIVNAGIGGTTISDQRHVLERVRPLRPDLVLLQFSENDVSDLSQSPGAWEQFAAHRVAKSRWPLRWLYPVLRRTALWNLGLRVAGERRVVGPPTVAGPDRALLRARYREMLAAMRDSVGAAGAQFVFVIYPSWTALEGDDAQVRWVAAMADSLGITSINLLPALSRDGRGRALYRLPHDGHPSPEGYAVAARAIQAALVGDSAAATRP